MGKETTTTTTTTTTIKVDNSNKPFSLIEFLDLVGGLSRAEKSHYQKVYSTQTGLKTATEWTQLTSLKLKNI